MKKFRIILLMLTTITIVSNTFSQELSRAEKKSLKKELRKMLRDPIKLKNLKESLSVKETIVSEQSIEVNSLTKENNKLKNKLEIARDSIGDFAYAMEVSKKNEATLKKSSSWRNDEGMKYRLQIGLYEQFDISNFFEQLKAVSFEKTDDNMFRYTIGNFETEYDAELFKSAVRQMGLKDAFVSYYLDGTRIPKD